MHETPKSRARADRDVDVWEYRDDLERLARHLCRHPEDAADITHTALLKAAERLDGFRGESSVRTWLHAITSNECRMLRRRRQPSSLDQLLDDSEGPTAVGADVNDPEELALELETRREVLSALERLPDRYRCALLLKDGRDLSLEEVAEVMESTVPAVKSLLYRARNQLREDIA